jgi:hypothetical protein
MNPAQNPEKAPHHRGFPYVPRGGIRAEQISETFKQQCQGCTAKHHADDP